MAIAAQQKHYFTTFELILLALFSSLVVGAKIIMHLPLRIPGHSGAFWMAILVVASGLVSKPGALSLVGITSGLLATFLGLGDKGPIYTLLSYATAGIAVDVATILLGGMKNIVVAAVAGIVGNVVKMLTKVALCMLLGIPAGFVALGAVFYTLSNAASGAVGGVLGWFILQALRKAGFFAYLAEKR
jgi:hypothetical protein